MANEAPPTLDPAMPSGPPRSPVPTGAGRETIYRHSRVVRLTHWLNVVLVSLLLMSGLQIFNAHPRLYWGAYGADADHPWLEIAARNAASVRPQGVLRVAGHQFATSGVLGVSRGADGQLTQQGFPRWMTLPSRRDLATGRRWHFFLVWLFVANGLIYFVAGALNGHFRRDLAPSGAELAPRNILGSIFDHIRLRHPVGEAAKSFNVLQKLTYLAVIFAILPMMILTGLAMSPGIDAAAPWLVSVLGGRQSARGLHFITANLIVLFVIVHVVEVILAGVWNELRSMITGRYVIKLEEGG
jgi:thiosulfate reductase cytochrome b subunit